MELSVVLNVTALPPWPPSFGTVIQIFSVPTVREERTRVYERIKNTTALLKTTSAGDALKKAVVHNDKNADRLKEYFDLELVGIVRATITDEFYRS